MILLVANTIVGKAGNIGFRLAQIIRYGELPDSSIVIVARGLTDEITSHPSVHFYRRSPLALFQRGINSLRKNFLPKFNSRRWDIYIFNIFFVYSYYTRLRFEEYEAVLLCETSAFIMKFLKKRGLEIILDVPIAPQKHIVDHLSKDARTKMKLQYFYWLSTQEETCFRLANKIICPSDHIATLLRSYSTNVRVIPFGVNEVELAPERFSSTSKLTLGFLGNISDRKGANVLIEEFCTSGDSLKARLILQGKNYYGAINDPAFFNGSIELRGFGSIDRFFSDIDCLVFPSLMEGSAKVIYEAIARGVPVFTTRYAGPPFFDEYGIFNIEPGSVNFEEIIKKMNARDHYHIDHEYISWFVNRYSWKNYAASVLSATLEAKR